MKYSFRPNLFQKHYGLQISEEQLHRVDAQGQVIRRYDLRDIKSLQKVSCGKIEDPVTGTQTAEQCTIRFHSRWPITIKSASYTGPGTGIDHGPTYRLFLSQLMDKLARSNPSVTVTEGSLGLVVAWHTLRIGCLLVALLGLGMLGHSLLTGEWSNNKSLVALSSLFVGAGGLRVAGALIHMYQPTSAPVADARMG